MNFSSSKTFPSNIGMINLSWAIEEHLYNQILATTKAIV
jgi:hypothetical protein